MLPHWTEKDLVVNGNKIHYTRTGDGSKPPVVLAHGFSDSGLCWLPVAQELEAHYDVILPDARGHGLSARLTPGEALDMPGDLAGLVRALGLDRPVIGGHSMGGSVSGRLAARYPGLARALILEDPGWFDRPAEKPTDEPRQPSPYQAWLMSLSGKSVEEVMAKCRADSPTWAEVELRPWAMSKLQFDPTFFQADFGEEENWRDTARAIDCPVLLLTADVEKGALISPEMAQAAVGLNGRIRVAHVPGAGHNVRREGYAEFMRLVKGFLKEIYP